MTVLAGSAARAATDRKEAAEILPRIGAVHTFQVLRQDQLDLMDITALEPHFHRERHVILFALGT